MTSDRTFTGEYTLRLARNLIFMSYMKSGFNVRVEQFEFSSIEKDIGKIPDCWNSGLFRYIDEVINLTNTAELCQLSSSIINKEKEHYAIVVILHQIKMCLTSIRVIGAHGIDSQSRIILRSLYENCIVACRCIVDVDFRNDFMDANTIESANSFWHTNISKSKTEKFLVKYNAENKDRCPLVIGDTFNEIYRKLGISAHPSYFVGSIGYKSYMSDAGTLDSIVGGPKNTTEFTLTSACHLALSTLFFISRKASELAGTAPWIVKDHPLWKFEMAADALDALGSVSSLMQLFLMKWSNRQRDDFDPDVHF